MSSSALPCHWESMEGKKIFRPTQEESTALDALIAALEAPRRYVLMQQLTWMSVRRNIKPGCSVKTVSLCGSIKRSERKDGSGGADSLTKGTSDNLPSTEQKMHSVFVKLTRLKYLLSNCRNFKEDESLLQAMGRAMDDTVDRTPKCHCELAGEGIEYSWSCAKNLYRRKPIAEKRKKELFREMVRAYLSQTDLTTERVRKCAKRARDYICAYHIFHQQENSDSTNRTHTATPATTTPTTDDNTNEPKQDEISPPIKIENSSRRIKLTGALWTSTSTS